MILRVLIAFILFCLEQNSVFSNDSKILKMVHLLYRHGARSPVAFYPNNPIQEGNWTDGAGRLTQKGMVLEYELGKFLKERYTTKMKFIHPEYLHKEVRIQSSDVERCLQSAETQLAGLYPPIGRQKWNKNIDWQPVPVHTVPKDKDPLINPDDTRCPRRDQIWKNKKSSEAYKQKEKQYQKLFDFATQNAGMEVDMENVWVVVDDYICEQAQNFTSPKWVADKLTDLKAVSNWVFLNKYSGNDELGRLLGGTMLGKIIDDMNSMKAGKGSKLFQLNIYSGHDTSVLSLTAALDIDLGIAPGFAACFIIELYTDNSGKWFVEMNYRNDSSGELIPFSLKGCEHSCPLDKFQSLTKNRVTRDQKKDCGLEEAYDSLNSKYIKLKHLKTVVVVVLALLVFLFAVALVINVRFLKKKKMLYGRTHAEEKEHFIQDDKPEIA